MKLLNPSTTTRRVLCLCLVMTTLLAWYSSLAVYRVTWGVLDFIENPQPFPYPDRFILWLNDWYDRCYPVEPGYFKLHGEIDRVRLTFAAVFFPTALASLILLQLIVAPWIYPRLKPGPKVPISAD